MRMLPSALLLNIINIIIVFVWTGQNDCKTQRKDTDFFVNGEKIPVFKEPSLSKRRTLLYRDRLVHALTQNAMRKLKQRNYGPTEGEKERKCLSLSHSN